MRTLTGHMDRVTGVGVDPTGRRCERKEYGRIKNLLRDSLTFSRHCSIRIICLLLVGPLERHIFNFRGFGPQTIHTLARYTP